MPFSVPPDAAGNRRQSIFPGDLALRDSIHHTEQRAAGQRSAELQAVDRGDGESDGRVWNAELAEREIAEGELGTFEDTNRARIGVADPIPVPDRGEMIGIPQQVAV